MELRGLSTIDAIRTVLENSGKPMTSNDIADKMIENGFKFTSSNTPTATVVSTSILYYARKSYEEFYRNDNHEYGLSKWIDEEDAKTFFADLQNCKRGRRAGTHVERHAELSGDSIDIPEDSVLDLRKCPSYKSLKADLPKNFVNKLSASYAEFKENIAKHFTYNKRVTATCLRSIVAMPLLNLLGYSVFDADEVRSDFEVSGQLFDYAILDSNKDVKFVVRCLTSAANLARDTVQQYTNTPVIVIQDVTCHLFNKGTLLTSFNLMNASDILLYLVALHKQTFRLSAIGEQVFYSTITSFLVDRFKNPDTSLLEYICKQLGLNSSTVNVLDIYNKVIGDVVKQLNKELN